MSETKRAFQDIAAMLGNAGWGGVQDRPAADTLQKSARLPSDYSWLLGGAVVLLGVCVLFPVLATRYWGGRAVPPDQVYERLDDLEMERDKLHIALGKLEKEVQSWQGVSGLASKEEVAGLRKQVEQDRETMADLLRAEGQKREKLATEIGTIQKQVGELTKQVKEARDRLSYSNMRFASLSLQGHWRVTAISRENEKVAIHEKEGLAFSFGARKFVIERWGKPLAEGSYRLVNPGPDTEPNSPMAMDFTLTNTSADVMLHFAARGKECMAIYDIDRDRLKILVGEKDRPKNLIEKLRPGDELITLERVQDDGKRP